MITYSIRFYHFGGPLPQLLNFFYTFHCTTLVIIYLCFLLLYTSDRLSQAVEEVTTNKDKLSTQCRQISVYEQEIGLRRKQLEALEIDREKDRRKIDEVRQVLTRTREVRISRTRSMSLSLLSTVSAACDDTYMYSVGQKNPPEGS